MLNISIFSGKSELDDNDLGCTNELDKEYRH